MPNEESIDTSKPILSQAVSTDQGNLMRVHPGFFDVIVGEIGMLDVDDEIKPKLAGISLPSHYYFEKDGSSLLTLILSIILLVLVLIILRASFWILLVR